MVFKRYGGNFLLYLFFHLNFMFNNGEEVRFDKLCLPSLSEFYQRDYQMSIEWRDLMERHMQSIKGALEVLCSEAYRPLWQYAGMQFWKQKEPLINMWIIIKGKQDISS